MAATRTEKSRYRSRYAGEDAWVTAQQWLAERMCERIAARDGGALPPRFWTSPRWGRTFRLQAKHASALLADFPVEAVTAALETTEGRRAYSLGGRWLRDLVAHEAARLGRRAAARSEGDPAPAPAQDQLPTGPRPPMRRDTDLSRLRAADGEEGG